MITTYKIILFFIILLLPCMGRTQEKVWDKYIEIALQNNPGIKAKYSQYQQALERIGQVKALSDPEVSAGIFISPIQTRAGDQRAKLSISQMFPWFGTLSQKEQYAALEAKAKYQIYLDQRDLLSFKVKSGWLDLILINRKIFYTKKRVEILISLEQQNISRFSNNEAALVNVLYVQMLKEELISKLELFRDKQKTLLTAFNLLLNREETIPVELDDTLESWSHTSSLIDTLWQNHPRLLSLRSRIEGISHLERARRLNSKPQIGLGLDYAIVEKRSNSNINDNGRDAIMPMVKIKIPLFGKKYKAAIKETQFKQEQLQYQYQNESNLLRMEQQQSGEQLSTAIRNLSLYRNLITKAKQSLEILTTQYQTSKYGYEQVTNMQQKIWIYQQKKVEAQVSIIRSLEYLNYLTGNN